MQNIVYSTIIVFLAVFLGFSITGVYAQQSGSNDTMTVEVNLIGFGGGGTPIEDVSIEVPEFIDLKNVTRSDPLSDEITIVINNTGSSPVRVTPMLIDPNEEIFSYLFFRLQKSTSTNDTDLVTFKKIGDFSIYIDKPLAGQTKRKKNCYMQLNITDYVENIETDAIGHRAKVIFYAMPE